MAKEKEEVYFQGKILDVLDRTAKEGLVIVGVDWSDSEQPPKLIVVRKPEPQPVPTPEH